MPFWVKQEKSYGHFMLKKERPFSIRSQIRKGLLMVIAVYENATELHVKWVRSVGGVV